MRLVPKADVPASSGAYSDRRLSRAKRVDYSHTKYAVVFVPSAPTPNRAPLDLAIRDASDGPRIEPAFASSTLASGIRVTNATQTERIVSAPAPGWLRRLAPGQTAQVEGLTAGELTLHLLGLPDAQTPVPSQVWIATGVTAEVESTGRYTLRGLEPGRHQLRAWHPRFPPSAVHTVELSRGAVQRIDLEIGVDSGDSGDREVQ